MARSGVGDLELARKLDQLIEGQRALREQLAKLRQDLARHDLSARLCVSVKEAEALTGVSDSSLFKLLGAGKGPLRSFELFGRRIMLVDLISYMIGEPLAPWSAVGLMARMRGQPEFSPDPPGETPVPETSKTQRTF
jgi:hypothetical protein